MQKFSGLLLCLMLMVSCNKETNKDTKLIDYTDNDAQLIIHTSNIGDFRNSLQSNTILNDLSFKNINDLKDFMEALAFTDLQSEAVLQVHHKTEDRDRIDLIFKSHGSFSTKDSLPDYILEQEVMGMDTLFIHNISGKELYATNSGSLNFISNYRSAAESFKNSAGKEKAKNRNIKLNTAGNTVYLSPKASIFSLPLDIDFLDISDSLNFASDYNLNFSIFENSLHYNGVVTKNGDQAQLVDLFKNTIPQQTTFSTIAPDDLDFVYSFTFDDANTFYSNLDQFNLKNKKLDDINIFNNANEIAFVSKNDETALLVHSLNAEVSLEQLENKSLTENYKDVAIYQQERLYDYTDLYALFTPDAYNYFAPIEDFLVFSQNQDLIKSVITAYRNEKTLSQNENFNGLMQDLSDEASLFVYKNAESFSRPIRRQYGETAKLNLKDNYRSVVQFIAEGSYAHINAIIGNLNGKRQSKSISENIKYNIGSTIINTPQFVANKNGKSMDIALQDVNNTFFLIDNKGKLLFKKQLDGKILGKINTIDTFKNGRKQLVFATESSVYCLSRIGQDVGDFPKKLNDEITQPLSVFDYDNRRNYRLLVTQGNDLLMLDKNGKRVRGFKYKRQNTNITSQPKHFRFGGKDYIVFAQEQNLRVLSRTGKVRINIREKFEFSDNQIYPYQDKFTFVDKSGNLIQVDANGRVERSSFHRPINPRIATTSKTMASLDENILKIRSNSIELDFGQYTDPLVFYINNKIYVSVTDIQANKVYLFDSQGKTIAGFPVYGSSAIDLNQFDNDGALEIITRDGEDSVLVYEF